MKAQRKLMNYLKCERIINITFFAFFLMIFVSVSNTAIGQSSGTLLYKQDFGGNDVKDPWAHPTGLPPGSSELTYSTTGKSGGNYYSLVKNPYRLWTDEFHNVGDHTFLGDTIRGYMMFVDPGANDDGSVLYQTEIDGLCNGMILSFSAWFMDINNHKYPSAVSPKFEMQMIGKGYQNDYVTTTGIKKLDPGAVWRQESFDFTLPSDVSKVIFKIINRENSRFGNDWAIDDIEIRLHTPPVITNPLPGLFEICEGEQLILSGSYTDTGIFGNDLSYHWEYSKDGFIDNSWNWEEVIGSYGSVENGEVLSTFIIPSLTQNHAGFYRLITGIESSYSTTYCHAASDVIELKVNTANIDSIKGASEVYVNSTITLTNSTQGGFWSSSDPGIASVNASGVVTGESVGVAIITYTASDGTCTGSVSKAITVRILSDCSTGGTLLYKQDFGGNDVNDPPFSNLKFESGRTDIDFSPVGPKGEAYYSLVKNAKRVYPPEFYGVGDHTHLPTDSTRGYMMIIHPTSDESSKKKEINQVIYETDINGLCDAVTLSFSGWFMDANNHSSDGWLGAGSVKSPIIEMQMIDTRNGNILHSTGDIPILNRGIWVSQGFNFDLPFGVTDVTFKILNRQVSNVGNDLGIDDIEIRLCTPPVFTTPSSGLLEVCDGKQLILSGTYTDNGLFGKNLSFRWEYSEDGNVNNSSNWKVLPNSEGVSDNGIVSSSFNIPSFTLEDEGYYRLVVGRFLSTYITTYCYAASDVIELRVSGFVIWTPEANNTVFDYEKHDWNIKANWTPAIVPSACNNVLIPGNSTHYPMLESQVECNNIYFVYGSELGRPDLLTYEKAFIQYNLGLSQTIQNTSNDNMNLVFNRKSTTERLLYSATVSATPIKRERWYLLSSPLKSTVTGDFSFGGFPLTFLKKFGFAVQDNPNYQVGKWTTPYNNLNEPVSVNTTDGFALFMYGFDPKGNSERNIGCEESGSFNTLNDLNYLPVIRSGKDYGIQKTNGILELPSFSDTTSLYAQRTQVYNNISNESTFYYVYDGIYNMESFNKLSGNNITHLREPNNGNYRFTPEIFNGSTWNFEKVITHPVSDLNDGDYFLVGNPFMSSIDIVAFCRDNISSIYPTIYIWNGSDFNTYKVNTSSGEVTMNDDPVISPLISPLQGFILQYTGVGDVVFNVENISTVRSAHSSFNMRSGKEMVEENVLRIKAENNNAVSYAVIGYKEGSSVDYYNNEDARKIFSPYNHVPEVYSLAGEIPTAINFINNNKDIIVPLGIKTEQTGEIRLTFTGMDNYFHASKIELIDAMENKTIDLTGRTSYTYSFNNMEKGIQNGRFSLRIGSSITSLPNINGSDDLNVYSDSKGIYVVSSTPVQKLEIYDLHGRKLYENNSGAKYYPLQDIMSNSPLIVKVMTNSQMKTIKIKNKN